MKKLLLLLAASVLLMTDMYAQTTVTNKSQLEGIFVFTNPTPVYDGAVQIATDYNTDCMWKAHTRRCRQKGGICTKGHTRFDMSDDLVEATLVIPGLEVDVETADQVPVTLTIGEEDYGEGLEATIYIEPIE